MRGQDMQTVTVNTPSGRYDVVVGRGLLESVGERTRAAAGGETAFVVSNVNVSPLYGERVASSLGDAGYRVASMTVGAGESIKNMYELMGILDRMADAGMTRDDVVVALGGGVVGDLAGFAAAVYMRGCKVVQVPTSLLAMVDSSVGGKTGVDLRAGKNLAGAFFQPRAVIADLDCLSTIDRHLLTDSCGEVLKYGVMCDPDLFEALSRSPINEGELAFDRLTQVVTRCVEIKRDVVDADEREGGIRQTLNLGHTIGHAIEAASEYRLGHGSCVAAGMCFMARACARLGRCSDRTAEKIVDAVGCYGLPITSAVPTETLFDRALSDKKRHGSRMNVVTIRDIGVVDVEGVSLDEFRQMIELGR